MLRAPVFPKLWEELEYLGPCECQHHPRGFPDVPQRRVQKPHRSPIAPVKVLEYKQHGMRAHLGLEEFDPGPGYLIAHELSVLPCRAQGCAVLVGKSRAAQLAQK